jgi:DNA-binding transcriptional MerR regulator
MLKIGDFSRLGQVSIDTLRHYDTLGLLKPAEVDPQNGYRYYAYHQLGRLHRILALKDIGLSLEQIAPMLEEDVSAEQLKGMLKLKRLEITEQIDTEQERLARVEARLKQIDVETHVSSHDVVLKNVRPQLVASIRRVIPTHESSIHLYNELLAYLAQHDPRQWRALTLWHDHDYQEQNVDAEATISLNAPVPQTDVVRVYELPGGLMASTVHNGPYSRLHEAYSVLSGWVEANRYRHSGPDRELYHYAQEPLRSDDETYVTEIQMQVEKKT